MSEEKKCPNGKKHIFIPVIDIRPEIDENGYSTGDMEEYETEDCDTCYKEEEEKYFKILTTSPEESIKEVQKKIEEAEKKPVENQVERKQLKKDNMITTYGKLLHKRTDAPIPHSEAMIKWLISGVLADAVYVNRKGQVLSSLAFGWFDESSSDKTPLIRVVDEIYERVFVVKDSEERIVDSWKRFNIATNTGVKSALNKRFKEEPLKRHKLLWTWDEVQEMAMMTKNNATQEIFILINELINGSVQQKNTSGRGEDLPGYVHCPVWFTGVSRFFNILKGNEGFWLDGSGLRMLFLPYTSEKINKPQITDIEDKNLVDTSEEFDQLIESLVYIRNSVKLVKTTDEFMESYNNYRRNILLPIRNLHGFDLLQYDNFAIKSKAKYPEIILKLAMVHAAARGNFENEVLTMEIEDLENAQEDLEYYNQFTLFWFDYWKNLSIKQKEVVVTERQDTYIVEIFKKTYSNRNNRYEITDDDYWSDLNGRWLDNSPFIQNLNLGKDLPESISDAVLHGKIIIKKVKKQGRKEKTFYALPPF